MFWGSLEVVQAVQLDREQLTHTTTGHYTHTALIRENKRRERRGMKPTRGNVSSSCGSSKRRQVTLAAQMAKLQGRINPPGDFF